MNPALRLMAAKAAAGGGSFNPLTDIAWRAAYWAEGPEYVALAYADGGAISTVPDEIGTIDMTQATAGAKPTHRASHAALNSKPAWDADGGDQVRSATFAPTIAQPYTVVGVFEGINPGGMATEQETSGSTNWAFWNNTTWRAAAPSQIAGGTADTGKHLFVFIANGASSKIIIDGVTIVTANAGTNDVYRLGMFAITAGIAYPMSGAGAFYGVAPSALGTTDLANLLAWSQSHYGTP